MKRAFLYTGGELFAEGVTERPGADDLILAADAGYRRAGFSSYVALYRVLGERVEIDRVFHAKQDYARLL